MKDHDHQLPRRFDAAGDQRPIFIVQSPDADAHRQRENDHADDVVIHQRAENARRHAC